MKFTLAHKPHSGPLKFLPQLNEEKHLSHNFPAAQENNIKPITIKSLLYGKPRSVQFFKSHDFLLPPALPQYEKTMNTTHHP